LKNYNLSDQQIEIILNALAQLPYAQVFSTIDTIQIQYSDQVKAQENQNNQDETIIVK